MKTRLALYLFLGAILFPLASYALMRGVPDDSILRVHVGDPAPLSSPELKKAHDAGKAIILMFGNVDHCLYCERTWNNIINVVPKYSNGAEAIIKDYRPEELTAPDPKDVALAGEYGLIGEPWVFVIDEKGIIRHIFPGFTGATELNDEILKLHLAN
jgi:thioredoxin-related protein